MSELSSKTALVYDNGLFLPVASRLAEDFGKVYYYSPWRESFPSVRKAIIGDGFPELIRCNYPLDVHDEVDLWVFPDLLHSDLQKHLAEDGHAVWGSRDAERLELNREFFMRFLKQERLEVPTCTLARGIEQLKSELGYRHNVYVKISRWRGDLETTHWRNWKFDSGLIDQWAVKFGPLKDRIRFLIFDAIETDLEIGADGYCVHGEWPNTMLNGIECKDKSYFAAVTKTEEMPEQVQLVLEKLSPFFQD